VVFCTGGAGDICSAQVKALVYLGANACIVGRNVEKTERMATSMAACRPGAKVLGLGAVDVRDYSSLKDAVEKCVEALGGIDFVMSVCCDMSFRMD
jgi:2,4-dienoyl-CoA reductase [(3E)-enoyl-CoA-producing], peroxisomal